MSNCALSYTFTDAFPDYSPLFGPFDLGVFLLRARSFRFRNSLVYLILFLGRFYASNFESAIQNFELGIPAPCKMSKESELPQPGPHGAEIPEQRHSFSGQ